MPDPSSIKLHGENLIAGIRQKGTATFANAPVSGPVTQFSDGTPALVDAAVHAAEEAFAIYGALAAEKRAAFLEAIGDEIEARADQITAIAHQETGLPEARLQGERGRTVGQLRLFADHIRKKDFLDWRHDPALPDRTPLPRPDLKLIQRPIGPVAVFGASNFPLAFSVAGGDTAAAFAAGCPVVAKGHPAHPGTCEVMAEAITAAVAAADLPAGIFSFIHGLDHAVGEALVRHPLIAAVGFTGSLRGGRALFDLCASRPVPIPFFGELGSVNPVFLLPHALENDPEQIAKGWAASLTMGVGQFCTNPGIVVLQATPAADQFMTAAVEALKAVPEDVMLTSGIAEAYAKGCAGFEDHPAVSKRLATPAADRGAAPSLYTVSGVDWLADAKLQHEVFGPLGLVVTVASAEEMIAVASALEGQLTATLHLETDDTPLARQLIPILERKAGRLLTNGWPTGVEVADAMVHGGPYPASTNFGHTSVGTMAIRRFLRPVCYQNMPEALLPVT